LTKPWSTRGVEGVYRFLGRVWRLFVDESSETEFEQRCTADPDQAPQHLQTIRPHPAIRPVSSGHSQLRALHACIKKVTEDLEHLRFNTAISALMVFVNEAIAWDVRPAENLRTFLILLHPFAPHLAEELWQLLHSHPAAAGATTATDTIAYVPWPPFDPAVLVEASLEIPVQVNGKLRDRIRIPANATQTQVEQTALAADKIAPFLSGRTVRKIIVVPGKLVNLVVG